MRNYTLNRGFPRGIKCNRLLHSEIPDVLVPKLSTDLIRRKKSRVVAVLHKDACKGNLCRFACICLFHWHFLSRVVAFRWPWRSSVLSSLSAFPTFSKSYVLSSIVVQWTAISAAFFSFCPWCHCLKLHKVTVSESALLLLPVGKRGEELSQHRDGWSCALLDMSLDICKEAPDNTPTSFNPHFYPFWCFWSTLFEYRSRPCLIYMVHWMQECPSRHYVFQV